MPVPFPSPPADAPEHNLGPKKIHQEMDVEGVTVGCRSPGNRFCLGLKQRFNSIACIGLMDIEHPEAMAALFKKSQGVIQKAGKQWLPCESLTTATGLFLDTAGKIEIFSDENTNDVVKAYYTPDLCDDKRMVNLSLDINEIASMFLDLGKIQLCPLCTTAFHLMFNDEFGKFGDRDLDSMIELGGKVLEDQDLFSVESSHQICNLVVACQMVANQDEKNEECQLFDVGVACAIPTACTAERNTRSKKK